MTHRWLLAGLGLALIASPARSQDKPTPEQDAAALLDALDKHSWPEGKAPTTLVTRGRCEFHIAIAADQDPTQGTWAEYYKGKLFRHESDYEQFGARSEGFDGKVLWEIDPETGVVIKEGESREQTLRQHAMTLSTSWRDHYVKARVTNEATVDGRRCAEIEVTPKPGTGEAEAWYVDRESKELVGIDMRMLVGGRGKQEVKLRFADYEMVQGARFARQMSIEFGMVAITFFSDEIETDVEIPDSRFALPDVVATYIADNPKTEVAGDDAIVVRTLPERHVVSIRTKTKPLEIGTALAVALPEVMRTLTTAGIAPAGAPFSRYHRMTPTEVDLEAGIPVRKKAKLDGEGRARASTLPACKVAVTWHVGPYHELNQTYARLQAWVKAEGVKPAGPPWEIYHTDPGLEPDSSKWRTEVFWPIK